MSSKPIVIRKDIPIPPKTTRGRKGHTKWSWLWTMEIGDCVDVESQKAVNALYTAITNHGIGPKKKKGKGLIRQRAINDNNGEKVFRVWRIS